MITRHAQRGDRVGLGVIGRRLLSWHEPERGAGHAVRMIEALSRRKPGPTPIAAASTKADVGLRVLEHMRPLDPELSGGSRRARARSDRRTREEPVPARPFRDLEAFAEAPRERLLRTYLEAFGLGSPPRIGPDRGEVDEQLVLALDRLRNSRPRPSLVYLWSPVLEPGSRTRLVEAVVRTRSRRTELVWATMPLATGLDPSNATRRSWRARCRAAQSCRGSAPSARCANSVSGSSTSAARQRKLLTSPHAEATEELVRGSRGIRRGSRRHGHGRRRRRDGDVGVPALGGSSSASLSMRQLPAGTTKLDSGTRSLVTFSVPVTTFTWP